MDGFLAITLVGAISCQESIATSFRSFTLKVEPPSASILLDPGDPYVAIICARDFFSADSSEFDEGVEGVGVGDGALCVGASSVDDIVDNSSRMNSPSGAMSDFEVKFVRRATIRLERGCLLGIEHRAVKISAGRVWAHPLRFVSGSPLFA